MNAGGRCSTDRVPGTPPRRQQSLLEAEGVEFSAGGKLDMSRYRFEVDIDDVGDAAMRLFHEHPDVRTSTVYRRLEATGLNRSEAIRAALVQADHRLQDQQVLYL